jgi:hypothetical protein
VQYCEKGIDARFLRGYTSLREGGSGSVVLIEHLSRRECVAEAQSGLSRYRSLFELGRLGVENVIVRMTGMQIANLDDNVKLEGTKQFVRRYMAQPPMNPTRQDLEFFAHNDEEILYHFLWPQARLISCFTPNEFSNMMRLRRKEKATEGDTRERTRHNYRVAWAEASANAFCHMPVGAAGVHIHSEGFLEKFLLAIDRQERRFAVYHRSFK